jgi:hypothetical protein
MRRPFSDLRVAAFVALSLATSSALAGDGSEGVRPDAWIPGPWHLDAAGTSGDTTLDLDPVLVDELLRHASIASRVRLGDVALIGGATVDLELNVIPGVAPDADVVVMPSRGKPQVRQVAPTTALAGSVVGDPDGEAFLAFGPSGLEGWIRHDGLVFGISDGPGRGVPKMVRLDALPPLDPNLLANFCGVDEIEQPLRPDQAIGVDPGGGPSGGIAGISDGPCQRLRVSIDTDNEFLGLFGGDVDAAAGYVATLCAATSFVYARDLNTVVVASRIRLWSQPDPWDAGNTSNQLTQFRNWWQANEQATSRDLAHMLSGRGLGGGIAWLPGVCGAYGYAVSANLAGSFPYPVQNNAGSNWDLMVFAHETGHNCGAPHTHDIGVDNCAGGDCSVVPNGTIMSYCHLCSGGLANMRMEFCPENIANITNTLASVTCNYDVTDTTMVLPDAATTLGPTPVIIDVAANDVGVDCGTTDILSFDAVTFAGGTVERIVDWIPGGRDALRYTAAPGFSGTDSFEYRVRPAGTILTGTVTVIVEDLDLRPAENPSGTTPGIAGDFFEIPSSTSALPDFSTLTPYASSVHGRIDFPSTNGAFADTGRNDDVAVSWNGWITVPTGGFWTFGTESDDGSRLWIGDELVVDNDGLHGMQSRSGEIGLEAGTHAIRVDFFERGGGAGCIVRFGGPGVAFGVIPDANWSHGESAPPSSDINGDGIVDGGDLGLMLGNWNQPGNTDLNQDGITDGADLGQLLGAWGS